MLRQRKFVQFVGKKQLGLLENFSHMQRKDLMNEQHMAQRSPILF